MLQRGDPNVRFSGFSQTMVWLKPVTNKNFVTALKDGAIETATDKGDYRITFLNFKILQYFKMAVLDLNFSGVRFRII